MSLGSIAHLQYYFARTGLLDGKGGQLMKKKENGEYDIPKRRSVSDSFASPIEEEGELLWEAAQEDGEDIMLPPTVSTYSHRSDYISPPPDQQALKKELVESLENALHALEECEKSMADGEAPTQGFYELQGIEILDKTTLAIRAAKIYYTMHTTPQRLNSIKSDHQIRKELYDVLDVLKKGAARKFAGGLREDERLSILIWVSEIGMMIDQEAKLEEKEKSEKDNWQWLDDKKWIGNESGRDFDFLDFLVQEAGLDSGEKHVFQQSAFWQSLVDGKKLIKMHNAAVKRSKKQFGQIDTWHDDTSKPYRKAENIRYWLKAAELRWELKLKLDVLGTVNANDGSPLWATFQETVMTWAKTLRKELVMAWNGEEEKKLHARARSLAMASPIGSPTGSPAKNSPKKIMPSPLVLQEELTYE